MSKPFSDSELSEQITQDRTWRIKEISDLKSAILRADQQGQRVLLRALVAICYAHWEGYIRYAARKYMEHIALRKHPFRDLNRQFLRNHFLPRLNSLSTSRTSILERCALIDSILDSSDNRFSRVNEELINTQSNLNYAVFSDICRVCGLDLSWYEDKQTFIDVILLKRRNSIAHGEDTYIEIRDMPDLVDTTIGLMRSFGDAIENHATLKTYKQAPESDTLA